jgi:hypothetical protein
VEQASKKQSDNGTTSAAMRIDDLFIFVFDLTVKRSLRLLGGSLNDLDFESDHNELRKATNWFFCAVLRFR